jgi:hypothetical protein
MSYLIDDEKVTQPVKKRDHRGKLNPHYNCPMSQDSRNKIAASQRARFSFYKKAAANIMTEERVKQIIKETIDNYLTKNIETKNNRPNNIPL